jgi:hypothetical protein
MRESIFAKYMIGTEPLLEYLDKHVRKNFEASHKEWIDIPHLRRLKVEIK